MPDSTAPDPAATRLVSVLLRVAASLGRELPLSHLQLVMEDGPDRVRRIAVALRDGNAEAMPIAIESRSDYSERLWPTSPDVAVLNAVQHELMPSSPADRRLLALGLGSLVVAPLHIDGASPGVLLFGSDEAGAYDDGVVARIASTLDMLALVVEREQLWAVEQVRHQRHASLAALLPAIAEALDVRNSFLFLAEAVKSVVPHDILAFGLLSPDRASVRVQAATDAGLLALPEYRFSNPDEALDANWEFLLAHDLEAIGDGRLRARISPKDAAIPLEVVVRPGPAWVQFVTRGGVRSTMRVPIRVKDRALGGLAFFSRLPDAYGAEDAVLGGRIADHLALSLAHQELADEERRIAEAEARAQFLEIRVDQLSRELGSFTAHRALGESAEWKSVLGDAARVAPTDATVLITGESGTGKEVVARFIHRGSSRASGPFVALNCAALPTELLESELFGHERGAFTGAVAARPGKLEQAAGGVLFLDEVGEMAPVVQAKFLRVLQEREFQRLGGTRTLKADIRVVAATNRDPRRAVEQGLFREDLYYRLGVFEIHLPPLRARVEDIMVLAMGFLEELGATMGRPAAGISEDARALLEAHSWPGNVRELRNTIERALILCHGGLITRDHLPVAVIPAPATTAAAALPIEAGFPGGGVELEAVTRDLVQQALAEAAGNKSRAAKLLGLSRGRFYSLLRRYQLTTARR